MNTKMFTTIFKKEINEEEMSITAWANKSDAIDRSGDLIDDDAWELKNFLNNPVIPAFHMYNRPPVGRALWAKVVPGHGLRFKIKFADTEEGREFYELYRSGIMSAFSVGFRPLEYIDRDEFQEDDFKKYARNGKIPERVFKKVELYEVSCVVVPDHMDALMERSASGDIKTKCVQDFIEEAKNMYKCDEKAKIVGFVDLEQKSEDVITKPEVTENYIRIPINDKSLFVDGSFRTITISTDQGIKAIIGKLKSDPNGSTKTHTYLFDKNKWDIEKAKKWVADHKKEMSGYAEKFFLTEDMFLNLDYDDQNDLIDKFYIDKDKEIYIPIDDKNIEVKINNDSELDIIINEVKNEIDIEFKEKQAVNIDDKINFFNSLNIKSWSDGDIKKEYGEEFDITSLRTEPAGFTYKVFCKYLGCKIKNVFTTDFFIPGPMKGNFLSAFKNVLSKHDLIDQRNFHYGDEIPLQHSVVKLNSKLEEEFLIEGIQFYKSDDGRRFIFKIGRGWGGLDVDIFTTNSEEDIRLNKSFVKDAIVWVSENNYLKGEKFSISGEFLDRKEMGWGEIIFPTEEAEQKIRKNTENISSKKSGRGMIFIGPPGTGKTMTGKVLMNNSDTTFIWASSKDFKYGASSALSLGFDMARELSPTIFFLEDIDTWINGYTVDLLKTEMDGMRENKGILTILTSNFPEDLPDALIDRPGRFHHIINFSLPDKDNRVKLLKFFIENADKEIVDKFADLTDGYSGSHIKELVEFARMIAEDEEISIDEALMRSLEQMKEQKRLIQEIKEEPKKKEIGQEVETKSFEYVEIEKDIPEEISFDIEEVKEILSNGLKKNLKEFDLSGLIEDRIKIAKGVIEFED